MGRDKEDNQLPDDEDLAEIQKIRDQQRAAEEWEAENPDPKR